MKYILMTILTAFMLSTTALAADLNVTDAPESEVETITFEAPAEVPENWFPLEEAAEYLPIEVTWNEKDAKYVIDSEPLKATWPLLAHQEITASSLAWRTKDLKLVDNVLYCSPWFLASRLGGVGFVHDGELWFCDTTQDVEGHIKAAMLELQVVAPEEYAFITKYLTGGIKVAEEDVPDALSYTYPHAAKPVCYISDLKLSGATMASTIAHEAWHVYQAKSGAAIGEEDACAYEKDVLNMLLREQRIWNGTIWLYE